MVPRSRDRRAQRRHVLRGLRHSRRVGHRRAPRAPVRPARALRGPGHGLGARRTLGAGRAVRSDSGRSDAAAGPGGAIWGRRRGPGRGRPSEEVQAVMLFCPVMSDLSMCCSVMLCHALFCPVMLCSVMLCSIAFAMLPCSVLSCCVMSCSSRARGGMRRESRGPSGQLGVWRPRHAGWGCGRRVCSKKSDNPNLSGGEKV